MMRRFEAQALRADLSSVEALLRERSEGDDPVGWFQFNRRKTELEGRIAELHAMSDKAAAVALYFGGKPVIGSQGILAEFGAKAVGDFQAIVSTRFASLEGPLGGRGPVPQRDRSAMMITEVTRGSFGFVLEEANIAAVPALPITSLKDVVAEICDLIHSLANPSDDDGTLEGLPEAVDVRLLGCLQNFFRLLDESEATLRVVGERRDYSLRADMIAQARARTDAMSVDERTDHISGRLFLLPDARRFELHPIGGGPSMKGPVTREVLRSVIQPDGTATPGVIGEIAAVQLRVRELRSPSSPSRLTYQLVAIDPPAP